MDITIHNIFPDKDAILSAMGFHELPIQLGVRQTLHGIITNSRWYDDIQRRYMPNFQHEYLMTFLANPDDDESAVIEHPFFSNPLYSYDRYLSCALIEYNKLLRYIYHCVNKVDLHGCSGQLEVLLCKPSAYVVLDIDEEEDEEDEEFVFVSLNKHKIRSISRTRTSLLHHKNKIRELLSILKSYPAETVEQQCPIHHVRDSLVCDENKDGKDGKDYVESLFIDYRRLHQHIHSLELMIDTAKLKLAHYQLLENTQLDLKQHLDKIQKYKIMDDLNMRAVEFCAPHLTYLSSYNSGYGPIRYSDPRFYNTIPCFYPRFALREPANAAGASFLLRLPDDLLRHIASFIGEDRLESVRRKCIMDRYFPNPRDDLVACLKKWRNCDLTHYSGQVFLRYRINFDRFRWRRTPLWKTGKKDDLIDNLLEGKQKLSFYEFLRDIFILTRILTSRRRGRSRRSD